MSAPFIGTSNVRELRCLQRLLKGPVSRKELDRWIGCANSPDVVMRLRKKGLCKDHDLKCDKEAPFINAHGESCNGGVFYLTPGGCLRVFGWLGREQANIVVFMASAEIKRHGTA